ncbi:MAG: ABC transporter ATP-binding protein [Planctomycetota bacterium]
MANTEAASARIQPLAGIPTDDHQERQGGIPMRVLLRPLLPPLKRHLRYLVLAILTGWGKFLLPLLIPWLAKQVVDQVITDVDDSAQALHDLQIYAAIGFTAVLLVGIATYYRHFLAASLRARVQHHLRKQLFHHIQRLSMRFFAHHHSGSLGSRVSKDITHAGLIVDKGIIQLSMDLVSFLVCAILLVSMNWILALITFVLLCLIGWSLQHFRPHIRRQRRTIQDGQSHITGRAAEFFAGISVVKAFAGEQRSGRAFAATSRYVCDLEERNSHLQGSYMGLSFGLLLLIQCCVVFVGAYLIITQPETLTKGELVAFLLYIGFINGSLQRLLDAMLLLEDGFAALERIDEILKVAPAPADAPEACTPPISGTLTLHGVDFAYEPDKPVLHDFSFRFESGKTYALVGPSGGGKSTICQLALRFYDPQGGQVFIDGHDLRDIDQGWYRHHVAVVLQDPIIFSGNVRENIGFGKDDPTDMEIAAAATRAQAHDFIEALDEGYDTTLGERGVSLSGGQRQRIAIARALMRNPRILILDEATSALDTMTERSIQEVIDGLQGSRTVLVIAHRLSTVRNVDCILVIKDGQLVEHGTYDELLAANGVFAELAEEQDETAPRPG